MHSIQYGTREGSRYSVAIPVRDSRGEVNGAVRLSIDSQIVDAQDAGALGAAARARHGVPRRRIRAARRRPPLPVADGQQLARSSNALHAERFELFLQPIRSLHDECLGMAHYEVLLRLRTLDGGLLEPRRSLASRGAPQPHAARSIAGWCARCSCGW